MLVPWLRALSPRWLPSRLRKSRAARPLARRPLAARHAPAVEPLEQRCLLSAAGTGLARLPLSFEANRGQADAAVRYLAHGSGFALALTDQGATLALRQGD